MYFHFKLSCHSHKHPSKELKHPVRPFWCNLSTTNSPISSKYVCLVRTFTRIVWTQKCYCYGSWIKQSLLFFFQIFKIREQHSSWQHFLLFHTEFSNIWRETLKVGFEKVFASFRNTHSMQNTWDVRKILFIVTMRLRFKAFPCWGSVDVFEILKL